MNCPGSIRLIELCPEPGSSEYAEEGNAAHALGEKCLREGTEAWMHIGEVFEGYEKYPVDPDMAMHVQTYIDYVRNAVGDAELIVEQRIENEALGASFGGTADAIGYRINDGGGFVHVFDLKYGAGIEVDAEGNTQMKYYAFGTLKKLGVENGAGVRIGMTIVQPRCRTGPPIKEVWTTSDAILDWAETELLPAMLAVDSADAPLQLGDHCRFCPARIVCPKMRENFGAVASEDTSVVSLLEADALAEAYSRIPAAEMYIRAVRDECLKRAMAGDAVPGTKLVAGHAWREWKDGAEDALREALGDKAFTLPVLKTPAQVEKEPGGKSIAGVWAYKLEGRPTLARADDKRPALELSAIGPDFSGVLVKGE
jgi:hypothetical protein